MTEKTMFLIRKNGRRVRAHIWTGRDTACRMWSTGGMKQSRFECRSDRGDVELCTMCETVAGRDSIAA